jgi:crossover junction endodeoxyribonuclease RusA
MSIVIRVNGIPAPQGSKVRTKFGMREASKAVGPWRDAVRTETQRVMEVAALALRDGGVMPGPVEVRVNFYLGRPKGHYGTGRNAGTIKASAPDYPAGLPDLDKLCRAVLDGLTAGGAWRDDGQVVVLMALKLYATPDQPAGCSIEIKEL